MLPAILIGYSSQHNFIHIGTLTSEQLKPTTKCYGIRKIARSSDITKAKNTNFSERNVCDGTNPLQTEFLVLGGDVKLFVRSNVRVSCILW